MWVARSLKNQKIVVMTAALNALKGQLNLEPKLSTIANEGNKKGNNKGKQKKNKKNTPNQCEQKKDEAWKKEPTKNSEIQEKQFGSILIIGVNTTWCGLSTDLPIACWASSTMKSKRRSHRKQSLLQLLLLLQPKRKPSLCRPHGHFGQPGGMMVQASMRILHVVSMHGWTKWHRTTNCNSPLPTPPSNDHFQPCIHRHPKKTSVAPRPCSSNLQDGSMAPL
jgi:hypothetical protein